VPEAKNKTREIKQEIRLIAQRYDIESGEIMEEKTLLDEVDCVIGRINSAIPADYVTRWARN
jgi:hypothetical protein